MQFWPPDDEHMCSKHVEAWNKLIVKQKLRASSWLITEINILRCTVSKTSKFVQVLMRLNSNRSRTDPTSHSKRGGRTPVFLKVWYLIKTDGLQNALAGLSPAYSPVNYWMWGYTTPQKPPPPMGIEPSHSERGISTPELLISTR